MIGLMSEAEIDAMLARHQVGRLGCTANDRPYVVPVNYVYDGSNIYCYSAPGRKIDTMREQPLVAFEVDEIESDSSWRCVIIEGRFHEHNADVCGAHRSSPAPCCCHVVHDVRIVFCGGNGAADATRGAGRVE